MPVRYVVNHPDGWAVKNPKGKKALRVVKTQKEAIDYAKSLSDTTSVIVQSKEGSFRKN
ncbi:DUF2188 domain-containing protein [Mycoplasma struthionis]|uniref:DUF2188 domain-containing protein n=1 Tax=Mycoplasma struthionis TaxID=538220 RepID=A0A3G8LGM1_9MOLU|nr:DUF2188 domain-containing protein [Mycoplasma struthionis]AZG68819.1 DUF2188 domain-containing protein [Mycoplasma struthionis]TPI01486.1 DUF2188 domain-containing protein [Mycoplasma struthionis]